MKRLLIVSFIVVAFIEGINAQSSFIQKRIFLPKANTADSRDVIETTPDNYVISGFILDSATPSFQQRLVLAGLDQNGNLSWRKKYGSNNFNYFPYMWSAGILIKKNNFLYSAIMVADSNYQQAGVFIKFDYNGDTLWQRKFYGTTSEQVFFIGAAPSVDNGFLITGAIQTNTPTFNNHPTVDLYLLKTDADGNKLWDKRFPRLNQDETQGGYKVIQDSLTKRILIVGSQDIGTTYCSNLLILDSLGNKISQRNYSGGAGGVLVDIIKTKDGNFAAVGGNNYFQQIFGMGTTKSMLVKFDTAGNLIYKQEYDSLVVVNAFNNISELPNGDFIIAGSLGTLVQYGIGINDILRIVRTDKDGNLLWKKYFDNYTDSTNQDQLQGMNLTSDKHIVFTSICAGGEPPPRGFMFYKTDTSYCDINSVGCYKFTGVEEKSNEFQKIISYPNPVGSLLHVVGEQNELDGSELEISNLLGEVLLKLHYKNEIDVSQLTNGYYILKIITDGNKGFYSKFIKE
ncbi:MAG: T9SS type A sorting domain-containing protein [Sphingobacteriaceae bacterium]|nr:T9SS type A sorting domain-containing protein [Sphingobacteriaceae bacterium]